MPRILIADDDEAVRGLVARALQMDGHATVVAQDGAEASAENPLGAALASPPSPMR